MDLQQSSEIKTYRYPNGEIQRVQSVKLSGWDSLDFANPEPDIRTFRQICDLYENFIVFRYPFLFGTLIFFTLPEDMYMPFPFDTGKGITADRETAAAIGLSRYIRGSRFEPDERAKAFIRELEDRGLFRIIKGTRPFHAKIMCISSAIGLASCRKNEYPFVSSAGFFTMDMFDLGSPYDIIGRPIGLCVKNGNILNPPLFERDCLTVTDDGRVSVSKISLKDLSLEIGGKEYAHGKNAFFYERPGRRKAPAKGYSAAVIGDRVVAVLKDSKMIIPSAGFIVQTEDMIKPGETVRYKGLDNVLFGIQAGNCCVREGKACKEFTSYFSNIRNPFELPIPPSLYPLGYSKDRAPRMALGSDKDGLPVMIWAEGPGKFDDLSRSTEGLFSCGASLLEMADICADMGMINGVNLDGGGSAQILLNGKRSLLISDRHREDNSEYERALPLCLVAK